MTIHLHQGDLPDGLDLSKTVAIDSETMGLLPQPGNAQSVHDLTKINADQARLSNLFKLALDEETDLELEGLIVSIAETQVLLKSKVMEL